MLSQALVYFLCLEDISHDINTQKRLNFNCKNLKYNIITKSKVFTEANDILIISRTSRVFFLKHSRELIDIMLAQKSISVFVPSDLPHSDIIIIKGKLIPAILRQLRQLPDYFPHTWHSFVREVTRLHNSQLLVDNDGMLMAPISHSKDIKLDFYGLCSIENRSYPIIIYTNCVQDFGQCELLLTKFVYPIATNQHKINIIENQLFRESFPFFCFFLVLVILHIFSKIYKT